MVCIGRTAPKPNPVVHISSFTMLLGVQATKVVIEGFAWVLFVRPDKENTEENRERISQ